MAIAYIQYNGIGAKIYTPDGPFGVNPGETPIPPWRAGESVHGDAGARFEYVFFNVTAAGTTLNQGDVLVYDNTYQAVLATTTTALRGMRVGTFFCGGNFAGGAISAPFSYTFPTAGLYGIWVQRSGGTLLNATTASYAYAMESTTTAGQIGAPSTATTGSKAIVGGSVALGSITFTANTTISSVYLTSVSSAQFLEVGGTLSGTGIPNGTIIKAINGDKITMSNAATATGSSVTITRTAYKFYATTTNGSAVLTAVTTINGIYPNQAISGTGVASGATIVSISGIPGNYSITMSAAATATGTGIAVTASGYVEGSLDWAYVGVTN